MNTVFLIMCEWYVAGDSMPCTLAGAYATLEDAERELVAAGYVKTQQAMLWERGYRNYAEIIEVPVGAQSDFSDYGRWVSGQ